jgi:hypothetical protein
MSLFPIVGLSDAPTTATDFGRNSALRRIGYQSLQGCGDNVIRCSDSCLRQPHGGRGWACRSTRGSSGGGDQSKPSDLARGTQVRTRLTGAGNRIRTLVPRRDRRRSDASATSPRVVTAGVRPTANSAVTPSILTFPRSLSGGARPHRLEALEYAVREPSGFVDEAERWIPLDLALAPDEGRGVPVVGFGEVADCLDQLRDAGKAGSGVKRAVRAFLGACL